VVELVRQIQALRDGARTLTAQPAIQGAPTVGRKSAGTGFRFA
jgi:hypothetical protein